MTRRSCSGPDIFSLVGCDAPELSQSKSGR